MWKELELHPGTQVHRIFSTEREKLLLGEEFAGEASSSSQKTAPLPVQ